jgi:periplasmic nitrate reductase NapD
VNISSVIVHPGPGEAEAVRARLVGLVGIEVHAMAEDGRMIVTVETDNDGAMIDAFAAINKTDGVMSAAMVYHQTESDPEMEISLEANLQVMP